jgi:hypothetical protein
VVRALFLAPLPGRFGMRVVPQSGALGFGLLFDFEVELAVFGGKFAQVLCIHPRRTFPYLFEIDVDTIDFYFADDAAVAVGLGPLDDDRLAE